MTVLTIDRSGTIRDPEEFAEARRVIVTRMIKVGAIPQDIELFMQFTTIIQALDIAYAVAVASKRTPE